MNTQDRKFPQELEAALEDIKKIREAVGAARVNHPVRLVARPLLTYSVVTGLIIVAFCVGAQLLLDHGSGSFLGLSTSTVLWILGAKLLLALWIAKMLVLAVASRRAGYDINAVLRATFTPDYLQILVPGVLMIVLGSVALDRLGGEEMILGFVIAGAGALVIPLSPTIGLPEWAIFGALLFVLGAIAMFTFPEWPFYKLAATWGASLIIAGLVLRPRFPVVAR